MAKYLVEIVIKGTDLASSEFRKVKQEAEGVDKALKVTAASTAAVGVAASLGGSSRAHAHIKQIMATPKRLIDGPPWHRHRKKKICSQRKKDIGMFARPRAISSLYEIETPPSGAVPSVVVRGSTGK